MTLGPSSITEFTQCKLSKAPNLPITSHLCSCVAPFTPSKHLNELRTGFRSYWYSKTWSKCPIRVKLCITFTASNVAAVESRPAYIRKFTQRERCKALEVSTTLWVILWMLTLVNLFDAYWPNFPNLLYQFRQLIFDHELVQSNHLVFSMLDFSRDTNRKRKIDDYFS